jgi:type II secretory pathway pseudopilin PulG
MKNLNRIIAARKKVKGFSLVELGIVLAVLVLITAIVIGGLNLSGARAKTAIKQLDGISNALLVFQSSTGCFPQNIRALSQRTDAATTFCNKSVVNSWEGPYMDKSNYSAANVLVLDSIEEGITAALVGKTVGTETHLVIRMNNVTTELGQSIRDRGNGSTTDDPNRYTYNAPAGAATTATVDLFVRRLS